uniref:P-loop NTPase fold protein n=1 Tax=Rhodococcus qingshengii TaxID=334542 RepID=UPI003556B0B8
MASLVRSVSTPANIALYGPWGSGKSGIANLLQSQVRTCPIGRASTAPQSTRLRPRRGTRRRKGLGSGENQHKHRNGIRGPRQPSRRAL